MAEGVVAIWQRWRHRLPALLIAICAAVWLFGATAPWPETPDGLFHLHRVRSLTEALRAGVLYPRWFPDFAFGYGYPVLNYYAPAFYYGPALFTLMGLDVITATRLSLALWYGASALAMMALLRCWTRATVAIWGGVLFVAFPYRLYDLFVRGALPEFAAFTWLPLIALFSYRLARAEGKGERQGVGGGWFVLAVLAWTGLILTHNLTALMAIVAACILTLFLMLFSLFPPVLFSRALARPGDNFQSMISSSFPVVLPLLSGLGVSAFHLAPSLLEAEWVMLGAMPGGDGFRRHLADWGSLATVARLYSYPDAAQPTVPLPGYWFAILALALVALLSRRALPLRTHLFVAWAMSVVFVFLMTAASAPIWSILAPVLGKLQFPWRWQTLLAGAFVATAATLLEVVWRALERRGMQLPAAMAGALLAAYAVVYAVAGLAPAPASFTAQELTVEQMWRFDAEHGQVGASWTAEFLPRWVSEERWAISREPTVVDELGRSSSVLFAATPVEQGYLDGVWRVGADTPFTLRFHRFYFPAWQVTVDGHPVDVYADGVLGLLTGDLDAGEHRVEVRFSATPALWLGLFVSGACILALGVAFGNTKRRADRAGLRESDPPRLAQSALSAFYLPILISAGAIVALAAVNLNWTARTLHPREIEVDYGAVRLEAATLGVARPGGALPVRLDWSMVAPQEALTTFVHVVDAAGQVAAQRDEPLAGRFTPYARWQPGMILNVMHDVPLPADLTPGVYRVYVGLYPAGEPDAPLQPLNRPNVRVEIGSVEIVP